MEGELNRETLIGKIAALAFASPRDAVELALRPDMDVSGLDLALVTYVKRGKDGTLELRLVDREALIRLLAELMGAGEREKDKTEEFYAALDAAAKSIKGEPHEV